MSETVAEILLEVRRRLHIGAPPGNALAYAVADDLRWSDPAVGWGFVKEMAAWLQSDAPVSDLDPTWLQP